MDALVSVLILWMGVSLFRSVNIEGWPSLIAAGAVAQFFSQPVVFVLAAIGAATVLDRRFRSSPIWRRYSFLAAFVWLAVFGLLFWFSYRHTAHSTFMRAFWAPRFIHLGTPTFWKRYGSAHDTSVGRPGGHAVSLDNPASPVCYWAAEEAARIEAAKSPSIWLFLPDAASHFINGFPMRRKLLEKLESKLEASGCRKVERDWEGETQVDKFECGDRTVSLKAREGRNRPERIGPQTAACAQRKLCARKYEGDQVDLTYGNGTTTCS